MKHYESPRWGAYGPPPQPRLRTKLVTIINRYAFPLLLVVSLFIVAAALIILPRLKRVPNTAFDLDELAWLDDAGVTTESAASARRAENLLLNVSTSPPGATVLVDMDSVGVTPLYRMQVDRGVHLLSIRKPAFGVVDTVLYEPVLDTASYFFVLRHASATPDGGAPSDGRELFAEMQASQPQQSPPTTFPPTQTRSAANDSRTSSSTRSGSAQSARRPASSQAVSPRSESRNGADETPQAGLLVVTSQPNGARVLVDGREAGKTPLILPGVSAGRHSVLVTHQDYVSFGEDVEIDVDDTTALNAALVRATGSLTVLVKPWGSIYVDGNLRKRETDVEYTVTLPTGTHEVMVVHPKLGRTTKTVSILKGESARIIVDLNEAVVQNSN